jgi:hypothetical protein
VKLTAFDAIFSSRVATGTTSLGFSSGSNSASGDVTGGTDVIGTPGDYTVVGLRDTVALASNIGGGTVGDVLTIIQTSPRLARFATPSNTGGFDPGWFNVEDYGAVHDGTTDDTPAIQDTIDAAATAGGGVVYFPKGVYAVSGALQDTSRGNAQIILPSVEYVAGEQLSITLLGEVAPPSVFSVVGATTLPDGHVILKGTLGTAAGTLPSLLGGWGVDNIYDFTNIRLTIQNLAFRLPENPVYSALNLSHVAAVVLDDVLCDVTDYQIQGITEPTTAASYGIILPQLDNGALTELGVVNVAGYYNGIRSGEHTHGTNVTAWGCKVGLVTIAGYHACHFDRLMFVHCERGIQATGGRCDLTIDQLNVEHAASGWWICDEDVDDPSNYLYGWAHWKVTLAGTGHDSTWTVDGAANFHMLESGDNPFGAFSGTAGDIPITDAGTYFTGTDVEAALQEIGADLAGLGVTGHYEVVVSGTGPPVAVSTPDDDDWVYAFVAD